MLKTTKSKNVQMALKHRKWVKNEIDLPLKNIQKYISKKIRSTFKGVEDENHVIQICKKDELLRNTLRQKKW